ncbi:O-antigen ligase family protein [Psychromicrobium lacuslunae]|uniref:O-antigen ligase-related domain-containing protein n=1 Tax=Psychromicrobium lacuslunae TaxID=1618207 RepID=A0A0D4C1W0_9MICC|nr:O-antigen ligase family protein [Psychromicrobium lacuslunae]AJT42563.1 hypothetical protein UM93_15665 [Psychromicrobium lacuslunae]
MRRPRDEAAFEPLLPLRSTVLLTLVGLALAGAAALLAPLAGLAVLGVLGTFLVVNYPAALMPIYLAVIGLVWTFPNWPIAPLKPSAALLVAGVALAMFFRTRIPRLHWAHLVFLAFGIWSLIAGEAAGNSIFSRGYSISIIGWAFSLIALYQLTPGRAGMLNLAKSYSLSIAAGCALVIAFFLAGNSVALTPVGGDVNDFGVLVAAAFFLSLGLARERTLGRLQRLVFLAATLLCLVVAVGSLSRGTWLAIGVGLVLYFLLYRRERLKMLAAALVLGILALCIAPFFSEQISTALQQKEFIAGDNVDSRLTAWQLGLRLFAERPLSGYGIGSIQQYIAEAFTTPPGDFVVAFLHNSYVELLFGTGIVGTALFLVLAVATLIWTFKAGRALPIGSRGANTAAMLLPAVAATLVASFTVTELTYAPLWLAIALGINASSVLSEQQQLVHRHGTQEVVGANAANVRLST